MPIPLLGLGTWLLNGAVCRDAVVQALELGYRHVDTAQMYDNEADVGRGLAASDVPRSEVFLTTKIHHDRFGEGLAFDSMRASLDRLDVDHVDLVLVHWPPRDVPIEAVVDELEAIRAEGLTRAIGVSNFNRPQLRTAAARATIATNQVEFHALLDQSALATQARDLGIPLTAYQPLVRGKILAASEVIEMSRRIGATPAQVALRWIIQQGVAAIPMSTNPRNLADNLGALDISLSGADMDVLGGLARRVNARFTNPEHRAPIWDSP